MNEAAKLEAYKKKLEGICDENDLQYRLHLSGYPIRMTVTPLSDMDSQITMLEAADENTEYLPPDAKLVFSIYDGELRYKISERFAIGENLLGQLRNLFRKIHGTYCELFHRQVVERDLLRSPFVMPETGSNEREDEPLEEYEPEETPDVPDFPDDLMEGEDGER